MAAGFDPPGFWSLTPRLFGVLMSGAAERERRLDERAATAAWLGARLGRAKTIPKLNDLIGRRKPVAGNVAARMAALHRQLPVITMDQWRARHGG